VFEIVSHEREKYEPIHCLNGEKRELDKGTEGGRNGAKEEDMEELISHNISGLSISFFR
jgi:hypothetical protein